MYSTLAPRIQISPRLWQAAWVLFGTGLLTLSSYITVPMFPVPMTMQTLAVTFLGAFLGWRLGALSVMAWLTEAAIGAPVLAGGAGGISPFFGPTAGYLMAFPFAAIVSGLLAGRGDHLGRTLLAMMAGNIACLFGALWLVPFVGPQKALLLGVVPFVPGALMKAGLGAVALRLIAKTNR